MTDLTAKPEWVIDKEWAEQYFPSIRLIIHELAKDILCIEIAPEQDDIERATDYLIKIDSGCIACRIRKPDCQFRDVTLRSWRASGAKTEVEKIKEGFGRWYLYAWADQYNDLPDWVFLDLNKLRDSMLLDDERCSIPNKDEISAFITLSIMELMQHNCIVKMSKTMTQKTISTMQHLP